MVFECTSLQEFLRREFERRVQNNNRYSLRGFARQLGLSPGELSEILRGKRSVSLKSAVKLSSALGFNSVERERVLQLVQSEKTADFAFERKILAEASVRRRLLKEDQFRLVADWYHFAILNLMDVENFHWDPIWISTRLGITRTQARLALDLLIRLRVVKEKDGRYQADSDFVLSSDGIPSVSIRTYHRQILQKSLQALEEQSLAERDITGIGFAVDPKQLPSIKRDLAEFQEKLVTKYSKGPKKEVYHLEMALIRLTQGGVVHDKKETT